MEMQPDAKPPITSRITTTPILTPDHLSGQPDINVGDVFKFEQCKLKENLVLPPSVCPPQWDQQKEIEQVIISSSMDNSGMQ